jgi:inosine/xanthosine triphosphatase
MKKVVIASINPVKVKVAEKSFAVVFPNERFEFIPIKSESGVPDQPMNHETRKGTQNRLRFIKEKYPDADFWMSQEGGLYEDEESLFNRAWIAVCDKNNHVAEASTSHFYLPKQMTEYIRSGMELGHASDKFFESINTKHGVGAIGHLTDGIIDRTEYYTQAAIIALSQLKHKDWYK